MIRRRNRRGAVALLLGTFGTLLTSAAAQAEPSLHDYRYFRALSIDLQGRIPTRDELSQLESPGFSVDTWIDAHLQGPAYAERVRRVYMDLLRFDVGPSFQFVPKPALLRRHTIKGPNGKNLFVYFRLLQRRDREETDGDFCFTKAETGLQFPRYAPAIGTATPVTQQVLDKNTVLVKPYWLYRDYRDASPQDHYEPASWAKLHPNFVPADELLFEPDGVTPVQQVRVCKEEAQSALSGKIFITGRNALPFGSPLPFGRLSPLPYDTDYAKAHPNEPIDCLSGTSVTLAHECGCGPGLERCMPSAGPNLERNAFTVPMTAPLGVDIPTSVDPEFPSSFTRLWWGQEAIHFIDTIIGEDHDFREILTGKQTSINGPLAQFYKWIAPSTCCGGSSATSDFFGGQLFDYVNPVSLFEPSHVPSNLLPHDTTKWVNIDDRGPLASGILTMPIFLTKFGSRRGKAHILYQTFLCSEFVATGEELLPSNEPNLMIRNGCAGCHVSLEPLASYFTRVTESDWTYLPEKSFPLESNKCGAKAGELAQKGCENFYDPAFTSENSAKLRSSYGSAIHPGEGPAGMAAYLVAAKQFAPCVVNNIASSFLGRSLNPDDADLVSELEAAFVDGNFRIRPLVGALVRANAYRNANNLSFAAWHNGVQP